MVIVKKYSNRRLYDTSQSRFVTLEALAEWIAKGEKVQVIDAGSGEDITRGVLLQIVQQQEDDDEGMLPTRLLEQIIQHRNESVRDLLERTVPMAVDTVLKMQQDFRRSVEARGDKPGLPPEMVSFMFPWLDFSEAFSRALAPGLGDEEGEQVSKESSPAEDARTAEKPDPAAGMRPVRQQLLGEIARLRQQLTVLEAQLASVSDEDGSSPDGLAPR